MEEQNDLGRNLPAKSAPTGAQKNFIAVILAGLVLLGGLVYTNIALMNSNHKIENLSARVGALDEATNKLEEISKKGATDELLGFDKVNKEGYQAVFLTSGKVYFGKITEISTENIVLENVYYLRKNGGSDQSLVKLGCELHRPEDRLTLVRSSVDFWENLKENDKQGVVQAIKTYEEQYPEGQSCE